MHLRKESEKEEKEGVGEEREREGGKRDRCVHSGISFPGNPVEVRFGKSKPSSLDLEKNKLPEWWGGGSCVSCSVQAFVHIKTRIICCFI